MRTFQTQLNYSSLNEDSASEIRALDLGSNDHLVCVTGSGARVLDLVAQAPKRVYAVDINPYQNYLLELKVAAIRELKYEEYIGFVGLVEDDERVSVYNRLRLQLRKEAREYFDTKQQAIQRGIIYAGSWEQYFKMLSTIIKTVRANQLERLFSCTSCVEQAEYWDRHWNDSAWRTFLSAISHRVVWKVGLRDPAFYRHVANDVSISSYLIHRFSNASRSVLFKDSPFLHLLLRGKLSSASALPPHLNRASFATVKQHIDSIRIVTAPMNDFLQTLRPHSVNAYSLSDIPSYLDDAQYAVTWQAIHASAAPGARILERQFLVKRDPLRVVSSGLSRNSGMEEDLKRVDNSVFYSFVCATTGVPS